MHCVDLGESFQTHIFLQYLASIQPRTIPLKFAASRGLPKDLSSRLEVDAEAAPGDEGYGPLSDLVRVSASKFSKFGKDLGESIQTHFF